MYALKTLDKKRFALHYLNAFITNVALYGVPVVFAYFMAPPFTVDNFLKLIIWFIILKLIEHILTHIWNTKTFLFLDIHSKKLQVKYFKRITNMPLSRLNETHSGFLKSQIDTTSTETYEFLGGVLDIVNGGTISVTIFLITVFLQSHLMFIICLSLIALIIIISIAFSKTLQPKQKNYNVANSKYNASYIDLLQNIKTIKRLEADEYATNRLNNDYKPAKLKFLNLYKWRSIRYTTIMSIIVIMYLLTFLNLYFQMKNGLDVLPFLVFYIGIFNGLQLELRRITKLIQHYDRLKAADKQIEDIIGPDSIKEPIKDWNKLTIENLNFNYYDNKNTVIKIPKLTINRGDKICIMGESGQGKSTVLNILAGYLDPEKTFLKADGKKTDKALRVAYVSQEVELLNVSIRENICLGKEISDETLLEIFEKAGLKEWVLKLPEGFETVVGENGLKLSTGQKQRLNLIRGILLDKEVYILDEPTSNLDEYTEKLIVELITEYLKDKTLFIVTHRPAVEKVCKKHFIFENHILTQVK